MIISHKRQYDQVAFSGLDNGSAFLWGEEPYIKMEELKNAHGYARNAVSLRTGEPIYISHFEEVSVPDAELILS